MDLKTRWRQFWCDHAMSSTLIVIDREEYPVMTTQSWCRTCGKRVPPSVATSHTWVQHHMHEALSLPRGAQRVLYDDRDA